MAKNTKIVDMDLTDSWEPRTVDKLNYNFKQLQSGIASGGNGPYSYTDLMNTPTVEGSFEIVPGYRPYGTSHSFPATSSDTGELVIEKEGWWPIGIAGFSSGSVYLTVYSVYLSDIELGKCKINMYIYNRASSAQAKTPTAQVLWAKWDNASDSINGMPLSPNDIQTMIDESIGNGTITIKQGNTTKGTFQVNQSGNTTITLSAGGGSGGDIAATSNILKGDNQGNAIAATPGTDYMAPVTLATVATSGDYDDLLNKPTIPAAQVQPDWNEADNTKADYIKNKPSLATVATSGLYSDLSGTPSLAAVATSGDYDDLTDKPTIPAAGIPSGGSSGQYLTKSSNTDYDVGWTTGGGGGISLLDVYPVGSIYMSVNSTDPGLLFGGTWQQIEDTFLLAAGTTYTAGATGGEAAHTLTVDEMPSHTHIQNQHRHQQYGNYSTSSGDSNGYMTSSNRTVTRRNTDYTTATNQNTGGGLAHNNMPPYLAVYMWKRTA